LQDQNIDLAKTSDNFRWSAAVAAFGMILRESEYVKGFSVEETAELAQAAKGADKEGYRSEFLNLLKATMPLAKR
jgi:Ca-activated chloride channel family protein